MLKSFFYAVVLIACMSQAVRASNYSLSFPSGSGSVNCGSGMNATIVGTQQVTLEAWIKPDLSGGGPVAIAGSFVDDIFQNGGYALYWDADVLYFTIGDINQGKAEIALPQGTNTWHHVAGTWDGGTIRIYLDGVKGIDAAYTGAVGALGSEIFTIGTLRDIVYWTGEIDEVRLWDIARTQGAIQATMGTSLVGNEAGLVAYYPMDENSGTTIGDFSTNDFVGTFIGAVSWTAANNALPVELSSFTVTAGRGSAVLNWRTAAETNNHGFEIERRVVGASSASNAGWTRAGFVDGNGTTSAPHAYSYADANLAPGRYAYRLKQVDRDGKFMYSKEIEATVSAAPAAFGLAQNFPNPFNPSTKISFVLPETGQARLEVYTMLGEHMRTLFDGIAQGNTTYDAMFDGAGLASGVYFYRLVTPTGTQVHRMQLMK